MGGGLSSAAGGKSNSNIRFIELKKFRNHGRIPRAPDDIALTTDITTLPEGVTIDQCFTVFVSHRWTRAGIQAVDFDGRPEPDSKQHDKHKLIVSGITNLWETCAKDLKYCYLWIDYSCLNQSVYPARELGSLADIMHLCDCVFSPVFDPSHRELDIHLTGKYSDYKVPEWSSEPEGYCHRSWCRLELYYGGFTPLAQDSNALNKHSLFTGPLRVAASEKRRPHFLYNSVMRASSTTAVILPPPQRGFFSALHPLKGFLTKTQDASKIKQLVSELMPLMKSARRGAFLEKYIGEYNEYGQRDGFGKMILPQDDPKTGEVVTHTYEGQWKNDAMDGLGTYRFGTSGHIYVGSFSQNKMKGYGKHEYSDGSSYDGQCDGFQREGYGVHIAVNGDKYEGEFLNDFRDGHGKLQYSNGTCVYEGYFKEDLRTGFGFFTFDAGVYEGMWQDDKMEGQGTCRYLNGDVYIGMWSQSKLHGKGVFQYANGDVYDGEFLNGREHGQGKFTTTEGEVYEGSYLHGMRFGFGKQVYKDGKIYEGDFAEDRMGGIGSIQYPDGSSYRGGFKDGMKSGEGTLISSDGDCVYRGMFKLGKRHGHGVESFISSGDSFVGEWVWDTYTQLRTTPTS